MTAAELAAIRARCEAATSGPWVAGTDTTGCYWDGVCIYAVDALPLPDYRHEDEDAEEASERCGAWADEHERGTVAATHNYSPIPDDEHDANQRFIASAREDVPALLADVERLTEQLRRVVVDFGDLCDDPGSCDCSMAAASRMVAQ